MLYHVSCHADDKFFGYNGNLHEELLVRTNVLALIDSEVFYWPHQPSWIREEKDRLQE